MAVRIRTMNGIRVAMCAALTHPLVGDVYLDDEDDHALRDKYKLDYESEGLIEDALVDEGVRKRYEKEHAALSKKEKSWLMR